MSRCRYCDYSDLGLSDIARDGRKFSLEDTCEICAKEIALSGDSYDLPDDSIGRALLDDSEWSTVGEHDNDVSLPPNASGTKSMVGATSNVVLRLHPEPSRSQSNLSLYDD